MHLRETCGAACKLSSANSINIGRLVPQVAYYVYSYLKLAADGVLACGQPMNVVVPTGNFGNILAAYFAREMGVPIAKLICASNDNKVLTDFIRSGAYDIRGEVRKFYCTNSPSMDILISSNLERLLYLLSGRDGALIRDWMNGLDKDKVYEVNEKVRAGLGDFYGGYCTQEETLATIGRMWRENHYLMDTHTAVAYKVYEDYRKSGDETPTVIASTASAYKFAESVARQSASVLAPTDSLMWRRLRKRPMCRYRMGLRVWIKNLVSPHRRRQRCRGCAGSTEIDMKQQGEKWPYAYAALP